MPTYCTATQVAALLHSPDFTGSSTPTTTEVGELIDRAEAEIERRTSRAFKIVTITNEYHSLYPHGIYMLNFPPRVHLRHPNVQTFAGGSGDKFEVRSPTFVDWIADASFTEGEDQDYWATYEEGTVYLLRKYPLIWRPNQIRVTYRYGGTGTPDDIALPQNKWVEDICAKMAGIMIMERFQEVSGAGGAGPGIMDNAEVIRNWTEEINEKLDEETWLTRVKKPLVT